MSGEFVGVFTVGQTLDRGIRLYKKALGKALLFFFLPALFSLYFMFNSLDPQWFTKPSKLVPALVAYLLAVLVGLFAWIVVVRYLNHLSLGEDLSLSQIAALFRPKDLLFIVTYLLWVVVLLLSMLPLFIPFIYLANLVPVAMIVAVVEREYFFGSFGRTFKLCAKRWWKTGVVNLVAFLIVFAPMFVILMMWTFVTVSSNIHNLQSVGEASASPDITYSPTVYALGALYVLVSSVLTPIFMTVNIVHYHSLRSEKEGADIERQLDRMATSNAPSSV